MLWKVFQMLLNQTKDFFESLLELFQYLYLSSIYMRLKNYDVQILLFMWHLYKVHVNPQHVFLAKSQKFIEIVITCPKIIVIIDFYWQTIITNQSTVIACINKYN